MIAESLRLITDATAEPVSLADIKLHMRMSTVDTTEDALLTAMIKSARFYAENYTKRCLLPQTWKLTLEGFPSNEIPLMRSPLSTASSDVVITYMDPTSGNSTTLSTSYYNVDYMSEPGRVYLKDGVEWPDHYIDRQAVTIQFVAGFPINTAVTPSTDTCPEDIESWIKLRVASMYEHRESLIASQGISFDKMPRQFVDGLLDRHVLIEVNP